MAEERFRGIPTGWEAMYYNLSDIGSALGQSVRAKQAEEKEFEKALRLATMKAELEESMKQERIRSIIGQRDDVELTGWDLNTGLPKVDIVSPYEKERREAERAKRIREETLAREPGILAGVVEPTEEELAPYIVPAPLSLGEAERGQVLAPPGSTFREGEIFSPTEERIGTYLPGYEPRAATEIVRPVAKKGLQEAIRKRRAIETELKEPEKPLSPAKLYQMAVESLFINQNVLNPTQEQIINEMKRISETISAFTGEKKTGEAKPVENKPDEYGFTLGETRSVKGKTYKYIGNNKWQEE